MSMTDGHTSQDKSPWSTRLGNIAALLRSQMKLSDQDVTEIRGATERITASKERHVRPSSPQSFVTCRRQPARTYGEFVCAVDSSELKGNNEVIMLTRDSEIGGVKEHLKEAFRLSGGVLISVPQDQLSEEMEQLVLSTRHLRGLLDDFSSRQPIRRLSKVIRATLPIVRSLVGQGYESEARILALNQLFELTQPWASSRTDLVSGDRRVIVTALALAQEYLIMYDLKVSSNLDILDKAGFLDELLGAIREIIGRSASPAETTVACKVVWKLAASADMRRRMIDLGLQAEMWTLSGKIARTVETPESRKARQKAAEATAEGSTATAQTDAAERCQNSRQGLDEVQESPELQMGQALDEMAANCIGAVSLMLRTDQAKEALSGPDFHAGFEILLELATVKCCRGIGIGDERVPCMAAEALALVLICHGPCRMTWTQQRGFLPLLSLMRSPLSRVVLCGASILNAFLRGEPSRLLVSPQEAARALEEAAQACQQCLDELEIRLLRSKCPEGVGGTQKTNAEPSRSLHGSADVGTRDCVGTLEQATAACWGSLAVIDRCKGPDKVSVAPSLWLRTMLAVAKFSGCKWLPPWVTFCAVACISVGIGAGSDAGKDALLEINTLPGEMMDLLKRSSDVNLREHAARALCAMLSANESLRRAALEDHFLDKLQRLLAGGLGSPKLDSTIACSIMFLCDHGTNDDTNIIAQKRKKASKRECIHESKKTKRRMASLSAKRNAWTHKQLISLVWALGHKNQDVLIYSVWTLWLVARRRENRVALGRLWVMDGLVSALQSNARLAVKEGLLAATWLLACDASNTVRLTMNGGLQVLVGILNFPSNSCYVQLKTLAVGTVCRLCQNEPDVATLAMQFSLAPALLEAIYGNTSTVYLKVLSAGLIFTLCKNVEYERKRSAYLGRFVREGGKLVLEEICACLLRSGTSELQACGTFFAASLSVQGRSRHRLMKNGSLDALCRVIREEYTKRPLRLRSLHALLNLSTETEWVLKPLLKLTASGSSPEPEFASSILLNCANNPSCRSIMFEAQLARGSKDLVPFRATAGAANTARGLLLARHLPCGQDPTARVIRAGFLEWVQEIKGRDINMGSPVENGELSNLEQEYGGRNGWSKRDDETQRGQPRLDSKSRTANKRERATSTKARREHDEEAMMARVRRYIRQPVTSLWQTETERARTAPTRRLPSAGRHGDCLDSIARGSRIRPRSQASVAEGGRLFEFSAGGGAAARNDSEILRVHGVATTAALSTVTAVDGAPEVDCRAGLLREGKSDKACTPTFGTGVRIRGGVCDERERTPVPLRSSHRVGPVGALGSTPLPAGEYRWKPFVSDCYTKPNPLPAWRRPQGVRTAPSSGTEVGQGMGGRRMMTPPAPTILQIQSDPLSPVTAKEERDAMFSQAVKENQTVVVVEPPLNYKTVFDGPTNVGPTNCSVNHGSMVLFPHMRGASVCAPLYEHYVAEDGLCYHLYHTSRVVCDVLDPGGYPPLLEPGELRHVLQESLPDQPPPDYPSGKADAKPLLHVPAARECPPITSHCVSLCEMACRQANGDKCPESKCTMFGAMPSDFMLFEVSEEPSAEEEEAEDQQNNTSDLDVSKWDLKRSIFAPRRKEAESRAFLDTERVVRKALDADYARMLKEDRVLKLIAKADAAVVKGRKSVKESLEEVKKTIAPFYKALLSVFKYYCLTPSQSVRGAFSIQPNQFGKMMQDAELAGNFISVEEIGKIFVLVNFESDKGSADADVNEDRALMRFEMLEAFLRMAITMRDNEGQFDTSPAEKLKSMIEDHLLVNLPPEASEDSDTFRTGSLYSRACDEVLQEHQKALAIVYLQYSMLDPVAGKPSFGLEEWKTFTNDARLVGDNIRMLRMGLREIKLPFYLARMMFSDEIKSRTKMTQLTFVDFLEALARLAVVIPIPSDQDLQEAEVTDILDYETALTGAYLNSQAHRDNVVGSTGGALAPRLDRLIRFILGTLAIRSNGALKAGHKGMNMVGLYCTKEHLARNILP